MLENHGTTTLEESNEDFDGGNEQQIANAKLPVLPTGKATTCPNLRMMSEIP